MDRLERTQTGYVGRHDPDFFIAADPFFRGIDLSVGPDGNVFVIDWSDTGECHEHTGVHRLSGRIFKISYGEESHLQPVVKPRCLSGTGRLNQLWRDYQAGNTSPDALRALLRDPDEHVRVWAIRLLTDFWPLDHIAGPSDSAAYPDDPTTREMLIRMARDDESGLVHRVLASTLQRLPVEHRAALATELVKHTKYASDHDMALLTWYGLIPLGEQNPAALVNVARHCRWSGLMRFMARNVASQVPDDPKPLNQLLHLAQRMEASLQKSILFGMQDAFRGWRKVSRPTEWNAFTALPGVVESPDVVRELGTLFGDGRALLEIRQIALDGSAEIKTRETALRTLINARPDDLREVCVSLLDARILNATAVRGLVQFDDPDVPRLLVQKYRRFHPQDKPFVIETLVSRSSFAAVLLEELGKSNGQIYPSEISASHARQIQSLGNPRLMQRLSEVWGELRSSSADKQALIGRWKGQLGSEALSHANLGNGRLMFKKTCSQCHTLYGEGEKVGPDLTGSQRSNLDYLLGNIIDPSAVVGKDYRMSIVQLSDGRVLNGLVISKDEKTVVLQTATDKVSLTQDEIDEITKSPLSAIPDGLLQNLNSEQIRDLIAYLKHPVQVPLPEGSP